MKHYEDEFRTLTVYGGVSIDDQTRELRRGVEIFVGTVGRVLDHIQRENIDFSCMKTLILDEADQMLKLGFKEDVEQVMKDTIINAIDHEDNQRVSEESVRTADLHVLSHHSPLG